MDLTTVRRDLLEQLARATLAQRRAEGELRRHVDHSIGRAIDHRELRAAVTQHQHDIDAVLAEIERA
jgi:hypothetical protein